MTAAGSTAAESTAAGVDRPSPTYEERPGRRLRSRLRWRVVDIVVAAVLGVASGLVFLLWNQTELPRQALETLLPGLQGLFTGGWLFAGVLGGLVIRKPGAALFTELVAALLSALVGNQWGGGLTLASGLIQGLGAELVLLAFLYGSFRLHVAVLAGAAAGVGAAILDLTIWYVGADTAFSVIYAATSIFSGAVIAGLGAWLIARGLARTGALSRFAAGREGRADV